MTWSLATQCRRLVKALRRSTSPPEFRGPFSDFDSALRACASPAGYDNDEFSRGQVRHASQFAPITVITSSLLMQGLGALSLALLAEPGRRHFRVVDLGGGIAGYYRVARAAIPAPVTLDWTVVETPSLVRAVRDAGVLQPLAPGDSVSITDALPDGAAPDLVFASGTLHYLRAPYDTLDHLAALGAAHVILARVPVAETADDLVVTQAQTLPTRGLYNERPFWIMSRHRVAAAVDRHWRVRAIWPSGDRSRFGDLALSYDSWVLARR